MADTLNNDQKLKILSRSIDLMLGNGGLIGKDVTDIYKELHDLIEPTQAPKGPEHLAESFKAPWLFFCKNGVINLKSGDFKEAFHPPGTKQVSPVTWQGFNAPCFLWEQALLNWFGGEKTKLDCFQKECGSAMIGMIHESKAIVLQGKGGSGKSLILCVLAKVMGNYSKFFGSELLHAQNTEFNCTGPNHNIGLLRGIRMAFLRGDWKRSDPSILKFLCGNDRLRGWNPDKNQEDTFQPSHTLFIETDSIGKQFTDDPAIRARLRVFPMQTQFFESEELRKGERLADPNLLDKLSEELPGILAWLVKGCLAWQREKSLVATDWNKVENAFLRLLDTTRCFIEHTGVPLYKDECLVNIDAVNALQAAYQNVCQQLHTNNADGMA